MCFQNQRFLRSCGNARAISERGIAAHVVLLEYLRGKISLFDIDSQIGALPRVARTWRVSMIEQTSRDVAVSYRRRRRRTDNPKYRRAVPRGHIAIRRQFILKSRTIGRDWSGGSGTGSCHIESRKGLGERETIPKVLVLDGESRRQLRTAEGSSMGWLIAREQARFFLRLFSRFPSLGRFTKHRTLFAMPSIFSFSPGSLFALFPFAPRFLRSATLSRLATRES